MTVANNDRIYLLEACLQSIKDLVCGDRSPNWKDDWAVTHTRGTIADICDNALGNTISLEEKVYDRI